MRVYISLSRLITISHIHKTQFQMQISCGPDVTNVIHTSAVVTGKQKQTKFVCQLSHRPRYTYII